MNLPPMAKRFGALFFLLLATTLAWTFDSPRRAQALEIPRDQRGANSSLLVPAGILTVTTNADAGAGSLREAISLASPGDTINFSLTLPATITLTTSELSVNTDLTINGPGASLLAVGGGNGRRVFHIGASVWISGTTVRDGNINYDYGGGIHNAGTLTLTNATVISNTAIGGGGIANTGTTRLSNTTVMSNTVGGGVGGGIYNLAAGQMTVDRSTLAGNNGISGGIQNAGFLTLTNSTLSGNTGPTGGIYSQGNSTLVMTNTTVSGHPGTAIFIFSNAPGVASASLWNSDIISNSDEGIRLNVDASVGVTSTLSLHNSIVAYNNGEFDYNIVVFSGTVTSLGYNLSDGTIPNATTGDQQNVSNIGVGALANNGGATQTMALLPGSPAINAGDNVGCPGTDQRGELRQRTAQNPCDIGAFENNYLFLPLILK